MPKLEEVKIKLYRGQPVVRFNPAEYKTAYRQYQTGSYKTLIAMMNRSEADGHVQGCLEGRIGGFQKDWQISAFDQDDATDQKRAEWFKKVFDNLDIYNLLIYIQEARLKIFSVIEFEWGAVDGWTAPIALKKKWDHKYFKYAYETDRFVIDEGRDGRDIPDHVLIPHYKRKPVLISVLRDFILKEFGLESWAAFMERFGEPFLLGKYPAGASKETREQLDDALDDIASSSSGSVPKGTEIEIKETQRTTGDHEKFVAVADKSISIAMLGHANAVEQTATQIGENNSAYNATRTVAVSDMTFIDSCMKNLVRFIYNLNWTDGRYSRFNMDKTPPLDVKEHRNNLELVYEMGYPIHPEDVRKLGIRVDADEEPRSKQPSLLDLGT